MRAVGYGAPLPIDHADSLVDVNLARPTPSGRDLLVEIKAISVNPADAKVRANTRPEAKAWKILGWDAAGVVVEVGPDTSLFKPGDEVFYAGSITRPGTYAEFHLVDERVVGRKPRTLDWAESAALPLTSITAWESLFDRLDVNGRPVRGATPAILIVGGAGGVGSIAIQIARKLTDLTVIATASRPETKAWVSDLGAHYVVDHSEPLGKGIGALELGLVPFVLSTTNTDDHLSQIVELMAPQGRFALIDDPKALDVNLFKRKSISVHWEFMFTRSMFGTADMSEQGRLLNKISRLIDEGVIETTLTENLGRINAKNLKRAHALVESGRTRGKISLMGF